MIAVRRTDSDGAVLVTFINDLPEAAMMVAAAMNTAGVREITILIGDEWG